MIGIPHNILYRLQKQSMNSEMKFKVGAAIEKNETILSVGYNTRISDNILKDRFSLHAECMAILRALKKYGRKKVEGSTIYIIRYKKDGSFGNSKPCPVCQTILKKFNMKTIYVQNGIIKC